MIIPFFSTSRLGGPAVKRRLRRSRRSQLTAIGSAGEHVGRDLDRQSGSSSNYESREWVGAPNFSNVSWMSVSITAYGRQMEAIPFGYGGGPVTVIPADQPFSGRESGGGTRAEVYGNSYYGSGYPGQQQCGVDGRGFPFVFWPVVFTAPAAIGEGASYLYREAEYGGPDNSTRPGSALLQSTFYTSNSTFRLISDTTTSTYLYYAITRGCALSVNGLLSTFPTTYNSSIYGRPEQAVQYYRASSVVLTLDGYNNTAVLNNTESVGSPVPLPSAINVDLLRCVNATIGASVPLVGSSGHTHGQPTLLLLMWLIFFFCLM